jgi:hypothetical protein
VRLRAQKLATQWGDGDGMVGFNKLSLQDYHETRSVGGLSKREME